MRFTKMQGAGNDYIYINGFENIIDNPSILAQKISDRHFGVGSDGIVIILPSQLCDFRMRMFNSDGSEAEMCGNASRCIGKYVYEKGLTHKKDVTLETKSGIKKLSLHTENDIVKTVTVNMGSPILKSELIPVICNNTTVVNKDIETTMGTLKMTCVSMGNPHAVIFVDDLSKIDIAKIGKEIENNAIFPQKTNVEFVQILSPNSLKMRVWERGTGETLACGTGACATLVAGIINDFTDNKADITLLGGILTVEWNKEDNNIYMTGPAEIVFEGEWN